LVTSTTVGRNEQMKGTIRLLCTARGGQNVRANIGDEKRGQERGKEGGKS